MKTAKWLCNNILSAFLFLIFLNHQVFAQDVTKEFLNSVMKGEVNKVESYIEKGADVNLVSNNRHTPLMYAMWGNHLEMIKLLVSKGADVNMRTEKGGTALNVAAAM